MKKAVTLAVATVSIASLVGATTVVSAHGSDNNWSWGNYNWSHWHGDKRSADVRFIDYTVMHHRIAIDMANVEIQKGKQPELVNYAKQLVAQQTQDIADLQDLRGQLMNDDANKDIAKDMQTMKSHDGHSWGMLGADSISTASNIDVAFIDALSAHDAMALPVSNKFLVKSDNDQLKKMVRKTINAESVQIGQLSQWRAVWYPDAIEPGFTNKND